MLANEYFKYLSNILHLSEIPVTIIFNYMNITDNILIFKHKHIINDRPYFIENSDKLIYFNNGTSVLISVKNIHKFHKFIEKIKGIHQIINCDNYLCIQYFNCIYIYNIIADTYIKINIKINININVQMLTTSTISVFYNNNKIYVYDCNCVQTYDIYGNLLRINEFIDNYNIKFFCIFNTMVRE
jgi:hypothetical protein